MSKMKYVAKGVVTEVGETHSVGNNGTTKREIVVDLADAGSKYPNPVQFTMMKDRCKLADNIRKGMTVSVEFSLDGRRWDGPKGVRHFVDLSAWAITPDAGSFSNAPSAPVPPQNVASASASDDALPF